MPLSDRYPLAVTFICAPREQRDGTTKVVPIGTGFVLNHPVGTEGAYVEYIVTASHVVSAEEDYSARFRTKDGGEKDLSVYEWLHHPKADVAVTPFQATADLHLLNVPLGTMMGGAGWLPKPELGDRVYFLGLLDIKGQEGGSIYTAPVPMARSGTLGALYQPRVPIGPEGAVRHVEAHLIDCRSYAGFSGSPCFAQRGFVERTIYREHERLLVPEPLTVLLGIVSGHFDQWGKARVLGDLTDEGSVDVPLNSGVGVVTPAERIREVLEMEELAEERERIEREQVQGPTEGATLDTAPEPDEEFGRFKDLTRKLVNTPKREIDEKRRGGDA